MTQTTAHNANLNAIYSCVASYDADHAAGAPVTPEDVARQIQRDGRFDTATLQDAASMLRRNYFSNPTPFAIAVANLIGDKEHTQNERTEALAQ